MLLPLLLALSQDPAITVQLNHDQYRVGDQARVYIRPERDGHLVVLHADPEGRVRVLFPLDPTDDDFVRGGGKVEVRGRSNRDAFQIDDDEGSGTVLAAIAPDPFKYDAFVRNGHWDFRALGGPSSTVQDDPLARLTDIVQQMAGDTHFDYDIATYVVNARRVAYGYDYGYPYHFGIGYGYPFYDPFFGNPFCDPFFWGARCYGFGNGFGYPYGFGFVGFGYRFGFGHPIPYRPRVFVFNTTLGGYPARSTPHFFKPTTIVSRPRYAPVEPRPRATFSGPVSTRGLEPRTIETRGIRQSSGGSSRGVRSEPRSSGSGNRGGSVSRAWGGSRSSGSSARPSGGSRTGGRSGGGGGGGGRRH